jgi:nicotinate-nucleotide adenylyltransferase
MEKYEKVREYVEKHLSEKRFYHSQCVEERCIELAKIYGINEEKAKLVGIAHDVAKEMSQEEKIKFAQENGITIKDTERKNPGLLHAAIGAKISQIEFGFSEDMVEAIANHTTGKAGMDMLSKILYVSDAIGKDRKYGDTEKLYKTAVSDIDAAVLELLTKTIIWRIEENKTIQIDTVEARNAYLSE